MAPAPSPSLGGRTTTPSLRHTPARPATTRPAPDDDAGRDARRAVSATAARAPRRARGAAASTFSRRHGRDGDAASTRDARRRARRAARATTAATTDCFGSRLAALVLSVATATTLGAASGDAAAAAERATATATATRHEQRSSARTKRRARERPRGASSRTIAAAEEAGYEYEAFDGKAAKALRFDVPTSWVKAIDRAYDDSATTSGRTIAMIGNFKTIDTVSVRVETVSPEIAQMASGGEDAADARSVADALTANERAAVEALESFGVIGGVENGRSGTMAFALMDDARVKKGPDGRKYYVFSYETEVCRAKIEEGMGGSKICVGPQGDVLDSIQRRSRVVVTFVGNRVVKLHASAVSSRFDEVEEIMNRAVDSFALNVV